jgi:EamA domain-containing membrane protein RarD
VPTIHFVPAVPWFGEPMNREKPAAFGCIRAAVAIYPIDSLRSD